MSTTTPTIRPLPASTLSRLQTSLIHTTLHSAITSLLQNSLDASATTITLSLSPHRRTFTVTDTGTGIPPTSIPLAALLHHTSKHPPSPSLFGSTGSSLAALATHSILTITSRAATHRAAWTTRWVYGQHVSCTREDGAWDVGTMVRVEGLWADMPVRAKQPVDAAKVWEEVLRAVVEALTARRGGWEVLRRLVGRDENGVVKVCVTRKDGEWDLSVLRQVWGVDTSAWEKVCGKLGAVRVDGWVAPQPVMGRRWQVLLVDGTAEEDAGVLAEAVNRGFRNANFASGVEKNAAFLLRVEGVGGNGEKGRAEAEELLRRLVAEWLKVRLYKPARERKAEEPAKEEGPKLLRAAPPPSSNGKENIRPKLSSRSSSSSSRQSTPSSSSSHITDIFTARSKPNIPTPASTTTTKPKTLIPVFSSNTTTTYTHPATGTYHIDPRTGTSHRVPSPTKRPAPRLSLPPTKRPRPAHPAPSLLPLLTQHTPTTFPLPPRPIPTTTPINPSTITLTRSTLQTATPIAQVDNSLILLNARGTLLILDQHAASERIRVEHLYATLLAPAVPLTTAIPLAELLPVAEQTALLPLLEELESWGVVCTATHLVAVPKLVSERRPDRGWLAGFLRRAVEEGVVRAEGRGWEQDMRRCPKVLKEVVESRACRGAVMFGDALEPEEVRELVRRLAACRWPWICAHGRSGVVPVVRLGELEGGGGYGGTVVGEGKMPVRERLAGRVDWRAFLARRKGGEVEGNVV